LLNFKYTLTTLVIASITTLSYADDTTTNSTAAPAPEESPLTGDFDFTSNYIFRGISNSNNNPAVQGGLTYTFKTTGIYFNVWGSNVDFLSPQGDVATVEFDGIAGIANTINDNWSYDINIDRYNYPRASGANYYEGIGNLTYRIFTATLGYSTDVYGSHKKGTYYSGAINYDVDPKYTFNVTDVSVMGSVGHYHLPESAGLLSYTDYMLGIQKKIKQYTILVQWTNTNGESHQSPLDTSKIVGTLTVNF